MNIETALHLLKKDVQVPVPPYIERAENDSALNAARSGACGACGICGGACGACGACGR